MSHAYEEPISYSVPPSAEGDDVRQEDWGPAPKFDTEYKGVFSREEQLNYVQGLGHEALDMLGGKSDDYAPDYNLFSAFEFIGMVCDYARANGVSGQDMAFVLFLAVKLSRGITTCNRAKVNNESFEDTMQDFMNYALLWAGSKAVPGVD